MNDTYPITPNNPPHAVNTPFDYVQITQLVLMVLAIIGYAFRKVKKSKCWGMELELNEETVASTQVILDKAIEALKKISPVVTPRDGAIGS